MVSNVNYPLSSTGVGCHSIDITDILAFYEIQCPAVRHLGFVEEIVGPHTKVSSCWLAYTL